MEKFFTSFVVEAAEILQYTQSMGCTECAKTFLNRFTGAKPQAPVVYTLAQKGFARIDKNEILLDPAIKLMFDNLCAADRLIDGEEISVLFCPNMILTIREKTAKVKKLVITPVKDQKELVSFAGEQMLRQENNRFIHCSLKEYLGAQASEEEPYA